MMIASPEVSASRWNWLPGARPRTSPGTGRTRLMPARAGQAMSERRPEAVRTVCSSDTAPLSPLREFFTSWAISDEASTCL